MRTTQTLTRRGLLGVGAAVPVLAGLRLDVGEQAIATRKRILSQVAADRALVMGYHFPFPALGYVETTGSAYRWNPVPWTW